MIYNREFFEKLCKDNNLVLLNDYSDIKITSKTLIEGTCTHENCNENYSKTLGAMYLYSVYCKKCTKLEKREKYKKTCLVKFGYENATQNKQIKENTKNTNLKKYGVTNVFQNLNIQQKQKDTCKERYGAENVFQNDEIKQKTKDTCLSKYGVENIMHIDQTKSKIKKTNLLRFGTEYASQNKEIKQKVKDTCLLNFGVNYALQSKEVRDKGIATNLINYGTRFPMQNAEYAEKASKKAYLLKPYTLPSGKIIMLQGFEHFAMNDLLQKENISEDDILNDRSQVPEIWYVDESGEKHRHYVDFYIASQNRCIEVKSTWTFERNEKRVYAKQAAAKELGLLYEIRVYDDVGNIIFTL